MTLPVSCALAFTSSSRENDIDLIYYCCKKKLILKKKREREKYTAKYFRECGTARSKLKKKKA
jgi:hypothetical protein